MVYGSEWDVGRQGRHPRTACVAAFWVSGSETESSLLDRLGLKICLLAVRVGN